jgi:REP element-mobilizing transposase RayT
VRLLGVYPFKKTSCGVSLDAFEIRMAEPKPSSNEQSAPRHLPRLPPTSYRGNAMIHWTLTVRDRGTGWLDARFTTRFRWLLLHGCGRYQVACPIHCLMPDHVHLLIHGWNEASDQRSFIRFLRRHTAGLLAETGHLWQPQAHDHLLRPHESDRFAFEALVYYIAQNPVRAGLVAQPHEWLHTAAVIPGYPELKLWMPDYWDRYWRLTKAREAP